MDYDGLTLLVVMICYAVGCITDCIWFLVFGIVFLILMYVILFMTGHLSKYTAIMMISLLMVFLISSFVLVWIFDCRDVLYPGKDMLDIITWNRSYLYA